MVCKKVETAVTVGSDTEKKSRRRRRRSRGLKKLSLKGVSAVAAVVTHTDVCEESLKQISSCGVHAFFLRHRSALRRVPARLPPKVVAVTRVKRVSWKDEGGGGGDPAVLAVGPARGVLRYSPEELLSMRTLPLSKNPPSLKLDAFNSIRKRTESEQSEEDRGGRGDAPAENRKMKREFQRRAGDPSERVRKESEPNIVLSPQRRSFTSGCQAPQPAKPADAALPQPKKEPPVRRIGSGRILRTVCDVTQPPWERAAPEEREEERTERPYAQPYRPPPALARDRGDDRYERRSFGRDSFGTDMKRDRDRDDGRYIDKRDREDGRRQSGARYGSRRPERDSEPEWYSGGPTSQHDTIELRGFESPHHSDKWSNGGNSPPPSTEENWRGSAPAQQSPPHARSTPTPRPDQRHEEKENAAPGERHDSDQRTEPPSGQLDDDLNLDALLRLDCVPHLLPNGTGENDLAGSRFSRWFQRDDTPTQPANNIMDGVTHTQMESNPEPVNMFAPISPVEHHVAPPSLLELLQRANEQSDHVRVHGVEMNAPSAGKIQSLEELEARMLGARQQQREPTRQDTSAFKHLLAQVSGGQAVPASNEPLHHKPQPMSLLQMLNKSMNAEQQQQQQQQHQQQQPPHIPQEVLYRLLQVQRQQQQQQEMAAGAADRELLQRTEAQAILHGLKYGDLTQQHLIQQLSNPGLQARHREMLITILKHTRRQTHRQMDGSPLMGAGPAQPPHLNLPPHHQQLRLSPLPHTGGAARPMLSPGELAARTQSIMQQALIKKKLEESRENFRRKSEQPRHIAFTPTSVLRKMTAEKEELPNGMKMQPQQPWPHKVPQGRPIVKGNQGGVAAPMSAVFQQQEFPHQHYMNHPQMSSRQFPQQQPHGQTPSQLDSLYMNSRGPGGAGTNTLQQLFMQSHRGIGDLSGGMTSGEASQLERWFSPELLAQAQAGKLPSVHVPNALCLGDLERTHHSAAVRN